jgi:hypothetical protein
VRPQLVAAARVRGQAALPGGQVTAVEVEQRDPQAGAGGQAGQGPRRLVARPPQLDRAETGRRGPLEPAASGRCPQQERLA